jgi:CRISPR-associated protein Csm1
VLPRALLAEFGLSKVLLGSSGGGQFLLVLPQELRGQAKEFYHRAAAQIASLSGGTMRLVFAVTENLGDWSDIRKRLLLELHGNIGAPVGPEGVSWFELPLEGPAAPFGRYAADLRDAREIGWSPDRVAEFTSTSGKHTWSLGNGVDDIPFARHNAPDDEGAGAASADELASRATGRWFWGILIGDVDDFAPRLRRTTTAEEHLQLSMMYKQFFQSEVQMRCSLPEFWQKVSILYVDGQRFAILGAWDALIGLAREIQRMFRLFVDANLKEHAGPEGKTISMAISLARQEGATVPGVYTDALDKLEIAKAAGRDSIWILERTLEWKQFADAADTRQTMTRMIKEFGVPRQFLDELAAFYRGSTEASMATGARRANARVDRPWQFYRRLNAVLGSSRNKEFQRLRSDLISDFTGRRASNVRLRPQGRVALEWAKLETENG